MPASIICIGMDLHKDSIMLAILPSTGIPTYAVGSICGFPPNVFVPGTGMPNVLPSPFCRFGRRKSVVSAVARLTEPQLTQGRRPQVRSDAWC